MHVENEGAVRWGPQDGDIAYGSASQGRYTDMVSPPLDARLDNPCTNRRLIIRFKTVAPTIHAMYFASLVKTGARRVPQSSATLA